MSKKIAFYMMSYKGFFVIQHFVEVFGSNAIDVVVTSRDESVQDDYYQEIVEFCKLNNIKVFDRTEKVTIEADYVFAISWRWLIKTDKKLIVFHDSILPKYRGFAPLVNALINKEPYVGATALFASEEYDKGDVIVQEKILVNHPIKIKDAIEMITPLYFNLVKSISNTILRNEKIQSEKQNELMASYSLWRDDEDYFINWNDNAVDIQRFVDAVGFPYKGACTFVNNRLVRIIDVSLVDDLIVENRHVGKVIFMKDNKPIVVCGKGLLCIESMEDEFGNVFILNKFRTRFK